MTVQLTAQEFEEKVIGGAGPVLVDFSATWCGPCRMLAPVLDEVAEELAGKVEVYKIDIDQCPQLAQRYGIMSVPSLLYFEGGKVTRKTMGLQPKEALLDFLA